MDKLQFLVLISINVSRAILTSMMSYTGRVYSEVKGKGKVFPYSLPSVGPGADPGVEAVSPQVT